MRSLRSNQQPVFYRLYLGQEEIVDQEGNITGSYIPIYSELKAAMLCVSANKGDSEVTQFGTFADYDRTMTTADIGCEIDENAVLWVDGADTGKAYNAIVKLRSPWKNSVQYAIKNVTVSQYETEQKAIQEARRLKAELEAAREAENQAEQ